MSIFDSLSGRLGRINELRDFISQLMLKNWQSIPKSPERVYLRYTLSFVESFIYYLFKPDLHLLKKHIKEIDEDKMRWLSAVIALWSLLFNESGDLKGLVSVLNKSKILSGIDSVFHFQISKEYGNFQKNLGDASETQIKGLYTLIKNIIKWQDFPEYDYPIFHAAVMGAYSKSFLTDKGEFEKIISEAKDKKTRSDMEEFMIKLHARSGTEDDFSRELSDLIRSQNQDNTSVEAEIPVSVQKTDDEIQDEIALDEKQWIENDMKIVENLKARHDWEGLLVKLNEMIVGSAYMNETIGLEIARAYVKVGNLSEAVKHYEWLISRTEISPEYRKENESTREFNNIFRSMDNG